MDELRAGDLLGVVEVLKAVERWLDLGLFVGNPDVLREERLTCSAVAIMKTMRLRKGVGRYILVNTPATVCDEVRVSTDLWDGVPGQDLERC